MAQRIVVVSAVGAVVLVAGAALWLRSRDGRDAPSTAAIDGRALYMERCAVCHGKDVEGAQGPSLRGIVGRNAGGDARFGYSRAMRAATWTWDPATLDRFLDEPSALVPGTTMALSTRSAPERKALIDYLATVKGADDKAPPSTSGHGGFRSDGPGVRHRVTVAELPAPFATESVRNNAKVVDPPPGAEPSVPPGFHAALFAKDLKGPRLLRAAPNGDLFVAASDAGEIQVLRPRPDGSGAESVETFAKGLDDPFGIAFFPPGPSPQWVYVAEVNAVRRYPYANGDKTARGPAETVVARLAATGGGHTMRDLAFSNDGRRMFVSVGSASNVAEGLPVLAPEAIRAFEATNGVGSTWGAEERRADVLAFDPDGKNARVFATGIRNCSGLTVHPKTHDVWCATNERDKLGDDLVPDYVTRVREGGFYGWPWYYLGDHEDPRHAGARRDLAGKSVVPDVLLQSHSAPLQISFYEGTLFPPEYREGAYVALHGSWNRGGRTGYKIVRVLTQAGVPTGEYEDFMTGFVIDDAKVWARPVGVTAGKDGALFVGEDGNGTIWRVTYR
ncbi:PQQ-dependent sugar dehydrogenase [Pendulispora albinea]|uniref:PQQ-dependent sugar dehydrogenase n=1 Tax=Pendulispora albinea TaxID=2741071 RepID=A0ABZ2LUM7_9BACT